MAGLKCWSGIQCCVRCCLRLSGETSRKIYSFGDNDTRTRNKEEVSILDTKSDKQIQLEKESAESGTICSLCLDILKDDNLSSCIEKVIEKIKEENYDSGTFAINAVVPNSVNIRQHSISLFTMENIRDDSEFESNGEFANLSVKESFKQAIISKIEERTGKRCDVRSLLRVTAILEYRDENKETSLIPIVRKTPSARKRKYDGRASAQSGSSLQESLSDITDVETMKKYYPCPPEIPRESCHLKDVTCYQESIFVGGRYNKYSRELSQTPWFIDGVRKTETSLQELACQKIQDFFRSDDMKFVSAGREDVDVRMLGSGRPFAVELLNPRKTKASAGDMNQLQLDINNATDLIAVSKLKIVSKKEMALLKEGEEHKKKFYSAIVYAKDGVSDEKLASLEGIKDLVLAQKTPVRVLHRRPLSVRSKTIHTMSSERIDSHHFKLFLSTQAGTYIKEFVHGDFLRTKPSLGTLLETETDILELDVEEIQLDWPPENETTEQLEICIDE